MNVFNLNKGKKDVVHLDYIYNDYPSYDLSGVRKTPELSYVVLKAVKPDNLAAIFLKNGDHLKVLKLLLSEQQDFYTVVHFCESNKNVIEIEITKKCFRTTDGWDNFSGHHIFASSSVLLAPYFHDPYKKAGNSVFVTWIRNDQNPVEDTLQNFLDHVKDLKLNNGDGIVFKRENRSEMNLLNNYTDFKHLFFIYHLRKYCGDASQLTHVTDRTDSSLSGFLGIVNLFYQNYVEKNSPPSPQTVWRFLCNVDKNWKFIERDPTCISSKFKWDNVEKWHKKAASLDGSRSNNSSFSSLSASRDSPSSSRQIYSPTSQPLGQQMDGPSRSTAPLSQVDPRVHGFQEYLKETYPNGYVEKQGTLTATDQELLNIASTFSNTQKHREMKDQLTEARAESVRLAQQVQREKEELSQSVNQLISEIKTWPCLRNKRRPDPPLSALASIRQMGDESRRFHDQHTLSASQLHEKLSEVLRLPIDGNPTFNSVFSSFSAAFDAWRTNLVEAMASQTATLLTGQANKFFLRQQSDYKDASARDQAMQFIGSSVSWPQLTPIFEKLTPAFSVARAITDTHNMPLLAKIELIAQQHADFVKQEADNKVNKMETQHLALTPEIKNLVQKLKPDVKLPDLKPTVEPMDFITQIRPILFPPVYTVVFLGESGTGKSTTICSIGNYLKYRTFEEARRNKMDICIPLRFTATPEGGPVATVECFPDSVDNSANENFNEAGQSVTQEARVHTFDYKEARFRIIDTPGLSDTRGMQQDTVNLDKIRAVVNQQEQIHAICLVLKSNESRLRPEFELATRQLLSLFPKKALDNVFLFFTFASGTFFAIGDSVEMLSTLQEKLTQSHGRCFQIQQNTCCIDAESFKYRLCQERSIRYSSRSESSFHHCWDHSAAKISSFLAFLQKMQPIEKRDIARTQKLVKLGEQTVKKFKESAEKGRKPDTNAVNAFLWHVKGLSMPWNVSSLCIDNGDPVQRSVTSDEFKKSFRQLFPNEYDTDLLDNPQ